MSVVIPAHDEARLLGDTLESLRRALTALSLAAEVLVVADTCTDATAAIAQAGGASVLPVDVRHIAAARNAGARIAHGDWLLFLDADTHVDARVLGAALEALRAGAAGGGASVRLQRPAAWSARAMEALLVRAFRIARIAPGCFLFCTRAAFDAVGGFDETWYAGEDVAMSRALARHGRFVILHEAVHTSGRKLRTHPIREQLRLMLKLLLRGRGMLKSREALDLWYGKRRDEID